MEFLFLGRLGYSDALALQRDYHRQCVLGLRKSCVLLLEHPPVITFGKNADPSHLLFSIESLRARGIEVVECDRGGEITAHMPGQLVAYPLISFKEHPMGVKKYINILEEVVIKTLATFGLTGERNARNPGVWVQGKKICALGIRISQRVAMHGLALNIENDLSLFTAMRPCGLMEGEVTSMCQHLAQPVKVEAVARVFVQQFSQCLE